MKTPEQIKQEMDAVETWEIGDYLDSLTDDEIEAYAEAYPPPDIDNPQTLAEIIAGGMTKASQQLNFTADDWKYHDQLKLERDDNGMYYVAGHDGKAIHPCKMPRPVVGYMWMLVLGILNPPPDADKSLPDDVYAIESVMYTITSNLPEMAERSWNIQKAAEILDELRSQMRKIIAPAVRQREGIKKTKHENWQRNALALQTEWKRELKKRDRLPPDEKRKRTKAVIREELLKRWDISQSEFYRRIDYKP